MKRQEISNEIIPTDFQTRFYTREDFLHQIHSEHYFQEDRLHRTVALLEKIWYPVKKIAANSLHGSVLAIIVICLDSDYPATMLQCHCD